MTNLKTFASANNFAKDIKIRFIRDSIEELIKLDSNPFAQVFLQQQLIAFEMASVIYNTRYMVLSASKLKNHQKWENLAKGIKDEPIEKLINNNTLNMLFKKFTSILPKGQEKDEFEEKIKSYIRMRNRLTHKMTTRYKNLTEIHNAAKDCKKLGEEVLLYFITYGKIINKYTNKITLQRILELKKIET